MNKLLTDILTCADNRSFDNGRVICLMSFLVYFSMAVFNLHTGHPWSAMEFSSGIGTMAVGFGFNLRLKRKTEPTEGVKQS